MQVIPVPAKVIWVFSQNDLKPRKSTFRSLSNLPLERDLVPADAEKKRLWTVLVEDPSEQSFGGSLGRGPAAWRVRIGGYGRKDSTGGGGCKAHLYRL